METQHIENIANDAIGLAKQWQDRANQLLTKEDKLFQTQMGRLLKHPADKTLLTKLLDQSFRSNSHVRTSQQVHRLLKDSDIPEFFSHVERTLIFLFLKVGRFVPSISVPQMIEKMKAFSNRAIITDEGETLKTHLKKRKDEGVRMNLNRLGEAVLGEEESLSRLNRNLADLKDPTIEYISVKISTIYSQIEPLAFDYTLEVLEERLAKLYQTAMANPFHRKNGQRVPKFVNLDMEEYHDLELTVAAFQKTLEREEFKESSAGIVLQAYLPDSYEIQKHLTEWAIERVKNGGAPIKIRIVKGANLEMEQVDAAIHNWPLTTYDNKQEVDSNYKRMVLYGMEPEHIKAVHLGIASHNLFELAFAYLVAKQNDVTDYFTFEMLEGMADHVRRAISEVTGEVLLYAPVAAKKDFINAIAYLIRRLDENTAPENFLRYSNQLQTDSKEWEFLKDQFLTSCQRIDQARAVSKRTQNRMEEKFPQKIGTYHLNRFDNEPDTDLNLTANRQWAEAIRDKWKKSSKDKPVKIPIVIAGEEITSSRTMADCLDASQFNDNILIAKHALANDADIERALEVAKADPDGWRSKTHCQRHKILSKVAMEIRKARGDLIGVAAADTGKLFREADVEVSEAVDFVEYYPYTVGQFLEKDNLQGDGKGVGLVVSPWNFPIAIPCGGIVAALASGNTVIFKPSPDAVYVAWELCQCFWRAGVSKNVLQFMPYPLNDVDINLVTHESIDFVILTGGTKTGISMLRDKPDLFLAAETGGKNATIVTAMSDRDQAIKNVVYSAFGNTGQKCSATSLLILEAEVFDDHSFRKQLVDATSSYHVGSAWNFENKIGPLIRPPAGALEKALTTLESGETWALAPKNLENNPYLWTPGIKWGVKPGSYTHQTEFFGPVLGVMRAQNLDHAIQLANQTEYGLTSGIESLDLEEQEKWKASIQAGNLYINRGTTGAITLRQPFGGMKKSALGAGIKAGSPNYVTQFMNLKDNGFPRADILKKDHYLLQLTWDWKQKLESDWFGDFQSDIYRTIRAIQSYLHNMDCEFSEAIDYYHLRGQDNLLHYMPLGKIAVRLHAEDSLFDVLSRIAATLIAGNTLIISLPEGLDNAVVQFLKSIEGQKFLKNTPLQFQTDQQVMYMMPTIDRLRYAAPERVPEPMFRAASRTGFYIACTPILMEGRIELLQYLHNQSISNNYHRYGNLGDRDF